MLAITGAGSAIARALHPLLPDGERITKWSPGGDPLEADRYVFFAGHLDGCDLAHNANAGGRAWSVNFFNPASDIDWILSKNRDARIVVLGSMSGERGSFDMAYAGSKAALHLYVRSKKLGPNQQLVCVAPSIVWDAGMTQRRLSDQEDVNRLSERMANHPKHRFLTAAEVAELVHFLLYRDRGFISGTVVEMHGGER